MTPFTGPSRGAPQAIDLWDKMKALDGPTLQSALGEWLSDTELRAILERRDMMERAISRLVADRGDKAVFVRWPTSPDPRATTASLTTRDARCEAWAALFMTCEPALCPPTITLMSQRVSSIVAVALTLLFASGWSRAVGAQPAIASDRPGLGTGAFVLEAGTIQIEAGAELAIDDERRFSAGQIVVRMGLPLVELQALVNSFVVSRPPGQAAQGFEDLGLGTKIPLVAREDDSLQISMLASLSLPTGSVFLTTDEAVPAVALLVDSAVSERWSVSTTLGYTAGPDAEPDVLSVTLTPGVSVPGPLNLGAFVGYAGFFASGPDRHVVEAGLTFGATVDLQLDATGGIDIYTGSYFVGVGFARRWGWRGPSTEVASSP